MSSSLHMEWNFTQICLIPKITNPTKMSDMRLISLCSVHYNVISKILCARLKLVLPNIRSDIQGAFVLERLILYNVLIAHEMVYALRTNGAASSNFMTIKTNMSKAYDRVKWSFLEILFGKLGYKPKWINLIMICVTTVTYSVLINEKAHGFIQLGWRIRQDDPYLPSCLFFVRRPWYTF